MQLKKLALSVAAITALGGLGAAQAWTKHEEQIIVHPFQWTYDMIADECENVLGPNGFDGVQISQPAEHVDKTDAWWAVYQPVNFNNFTTMTGNEQQLRSMIKRCNAAGVRVYADAVFNQRGSYGNRGLGGSYFNAGSKQYPDLSWSDFNEASCPEVNYHDKWSVYHCALSGMPDLNVEKPEVQDKVANYLKNLMSMGVYGFRIDASKHMQPEGISAILQKAGNPLAYMEVIGAQGEAVQPGDYTSIPNSVVTEFKYCPTMQYNIGNPRNLLNMADNWFDVGSDGSETFVLNHDNERCSAGTCYLNYKNDPDHYSIAQSFLVAWPQGKIRQVYSGYQFDNHDQAGPIGSPACEGGWNCEHRIPVIMNAVGFARATRGQGVSYKGSSDDGQVIWFTRGNKGFYVMNAGKQPITWTFDTHMPDGQYCEILQQPEKCAGQQITVRNGKAEIMVYDHSAAAICIDDSGKGFCGGTPVIVDVCTTDPTSEACYCKQNPNASQCYVKKHEELYFAGTTNGWKFDALNFKDGYWTIPLQLTGQGDSNGTQRFKITTKANWKDQIFGAGSGNTLCSNEVNCPDVVISQQGSYTLKVNDSDMTWELVAGEISNTEPVASFTSNANGLTATFENLSYDDDGDSLTYNWSFGDNTGSVDKNPTHTYAEAGTYVVSLTVNDGQATNTKQVNVTVVDNGDKNCEPKLAALYYAGVTNNWTHDAMAYDYNTCKWTIALNLTGAGDSAGAQRFKVTTKPNWSGDVYGTAGGNKLCKDQARCGDVKISQVGEYVLAVDDSEMSWTLTENSGNHAPVAKFDVVKDQLNVTVTNKSTDADGDELTYTWDFGDGSYAEGSAATHEYSSAGEYTITLTVSDGQATDTATSNVKVTNVYIAPTRDAMFYAGTTNKWGHDAMKYNSSTGDWEIHLNLTGAGDNNGAQRFKVTSTANWSGTVWGDAGGNSLCSNQANCGDVFIGEVGSYILKVNDKNLTWVLEAE